MNKAALLEVIPCMGVGAAVELKFKRLIGEGIVCSLEHDYENASKILESAENFIASRSQEISRFWYLSASIATAVIFVVLGTILWICRVSLSLVFGGAFWILLAACAGALGALLSVIARTGNQTFDCSAGRWLHYLEGGSRVCAGAISGMVVALAVKSEMVLAPLSKGEKLPIMMMLAAIAAGVAERMASSIVSTISAAVPAGDKSKPKS